jgi:hypothetical protein
MNNYKVNFFLDTEFIENGANSPLYLLSIGVVSEFGNTFYKENLEAPLGLANKFVKENVFPHLELCKHPFNSFLKRVKLINSDSPVRLLTDIQLDLLNFIRRETDELTKMPIFWGYYSDYDWVLFSQIFGSMINLPKGFPLYCRDLKQLMDFFSLDDLTLDEYVGYKSNHKSINDALQIKDGYYKLEKEFGIFSKEHYLYMINRKGKEANVGISNS